MSEKLLPGLLRTATLCALATLVAGAHAQPLYKCGSTFQDRPCPSQDVQQRFSRTKGEFSISQVNPDTDKDCAEAAAGTLPYWERMKAGESAEKLKAEIDAKPISRYQKSQMRDALIALAQYRGTAKDVRSQLESQCMNNKRAQGMPSEREIANASRYSRSDTAEMRARIAEERAARQRERQARAEAEWAARMEEIRARNDAAAAARAAARARRE